MRDGVVTLATLAFLALPSAVASAQAVPKLTLKPADAALDEDFSAIAAVTELRDGRVLVADPREGRLVLADLKAGTVTQVGRKGNGPGEYQVPGKVWPLKGDSGIMIGNFSRRWLLLRGALLAATIPADDPALRAPGPVTVGADSLGYVFKSSGPRPGGATYTIGDSIVITRVSRASGKTDTIARLRGERSRTLSGPADSRGFFEFQVQHPPFSTAEAVVLGSDGWLAIARLDPYRIDWRSPDGQVTRGAPLRVTLAKVTGRDREKVIADNPVKPGSTPMVDFSTFPERVPPFQALPLRPTNDGRVLVARTVTASEPEARYDLVDRRGSLRGQLTLARNERIVDFGAKSVYTAVTDDDGIQRLRRHPWP